MVSACVIAKSSDCGVRTTHPNTFRPNGLSVWSWYFAATSPGRRLFVLGICQDDLYNLKEHVFKWMANFIIMSGYRRVSFQPCVSHMFCHSILEFPFGFTYVLLCTFGACDEIYQVVCGAVTTQFTSVCVTCVRAFEVFRFVHFRTVAAVFFVCFLKN